MKIPFLLPWTSLSTRRTIYLICAILSVGALITIAMGGLLPAKYLVILLLLAAGMNALLIFLFEKGKRSKIGSVFSYLLAAVILIYAGILLSIGLESRNLIQQVTSDTSVEKQTIDTKKPFNVFISGIDSYGDIETTSRSDVNILATINPETRTVLLTSIPRDSYVPIAGGGKNQKDKLTHAGIYGIDSSQQTVANLLDTDVDSYVRINFTSFLTVIDAIGGVDVKNPVAFTANNGQTFAQGTIHMNGKDALTFSRERYNLAEGDKDRGRNQERVIAAIVDKVSSPAVIYHYQALIGALGSAIQTNLSSNSLTSLINTQINDGKSWKVTSTDLSGVGQTGGLPSYAMPSSQLYMLVLSDASIQQAKQKIQTTLGSTSE